MKISINALYIDNWLKFRGFCHYNINWTDIQVGILDLKGGFQIQPHFMGGFCSMRAELVPWGHFSESDLRVF